MFVICFRVTLLVNSRAGIQRFWNFLNSLSLGLSSCGFHSDYTVQLEEISTEQSSCDGGSEGAVEGGELLSQAGLRRRWEAE